MDQRLLQFLGEPVMMVAAAADAAGAPALGRVMGARPAEAGLLELFVSRRRWPAVLEALQPGAWLALTVCRPATYETYQVKGAVAELAPADPEGQAFAAAYMAAVEAQLGALGVPRVQIATWLAAEDLQRVRLRPARLFEQTPGPSAGRPVQPAP